MHYLWICLFLLVTQIMIGCATCPVFESVFTQDPEPRPRLRNDPLIGQIFHSDLKRLVSFQELVKSMTDKDIIYLSEKHNNPDHHRFQQEVILALIDKGLNPYIAFEFFSMEHTPVLLNFIESNTAPHSGRTEKQMEQILRAQLGWDNQTDQMWGFYYDLLRLARTHQLSVAGIDLSESWTRRLTRKGYKGLTTLEKNQIFHTQSPLKSYEAYMHDMFRQAHCGMNNPAMQEKLYDTWLARNDKMALSISQIRDSYNKGPVVVIIGAGHTEYRLGVMDRVNTISPQLSQINIGLTEISILPKPFEEYLSLLDLEGFDPVPPCDYIYFTQRVSWKDPCEEFKKALKHMKKNKDGLL